MVINQLITRGISDEKVLMTFELVPRHLFVLSNDRMLSYDDHPIEIGFNQTISQPYIVAYMTELLSLTKNERVLEIGTGSGYQTAILSNLAKEVVTIERIHPLQEKAKEILSSLQYNNIIYVTGNGYLGCIEHAPYDAILVSAAPQSVPQNLLDQLSNNGRMIIPVGGRNFQRLLLLKKENDEIHYYNHGGCRFVPLIDQD